eukprot:14685724-Ditylum_brightwellii.AAC.1
MALWRMPQKLEELVAKLHILDPSFDPIILPQLYLSCLKFMFLHGEDIRAGPAHEEKIEGSAYSRAIGGIGIEGRGVRPQ